VRSDPPFHALFPLSCFPSHCLCAMFTGCGTPRPKDPMFSECISFPIREDGVTVVGSGADADVRLAGDDVLPRHAVISTEPGETRRQTRHRNRFRMRSRSIAAGCSTREGSGRPFDSARSIRLSGTVYGLSSQKLGKLLQALWSDMCAFVAYYFS